jgi:hypothetical protein
MGGGWGLGAECWGGGGGGRRAPAGRQQPAPSSPRPARHSRDGQPPAPSPQPPEHQAIRDRQHQAQVAGIWIGLAEGAVGAQETSTEEEKALRPDAEEELIQAQGGLCHSGQQHGPHQPREVAALDVGGDKEVEGQHLQPLERFRQCVAQRQRNRPGSQDDPQPQQPGQKQRRVGDDDLPAGRHAQQPGDQDQRQQCLHPPHLDATDPQAYQWAEGDERDKANQPPHRA